MAIPSIRSATGAADTPADRLSVEFQSGSGEGVGSGYWYGSEVLLTLGKTPGRATIVIPTAGANDEAANCVAFDHAGPSAAIKHGMKCMVKRSWSSGGQWSSGVVFVGYVTGINRDRDNDALTVIAQDIRYKISDVAIVGRWVTPGDASATFQQGWDPHFNPGGRPNCLFDPNGDPWFSPFPDYGLEGDEDPPDATEGHHSKACYWTLGNVLRYLRKSYVSTTSYPSQFGWVKQCPADMLWPETFGAEVDSESATNYNSGVGQSNSHVGNARKGRDINLQGLRLLDALELLLSTAGGYALSVQYSENWTSTLTLKSSVYRGGGKTLEYGAGGTPSARALITGGQFMEDSSELLTEVAGRGNLVFIERRFSTPENSLQAAWTTERFDAFCKFIVDQGNDQLAFSEACQKYPEVLTTWQIAPGFDFQAGTSQSGYPRAQISRPPLPQLLSMIQDPDGTNPLDGSDFAGMYRNIQVEVRIGNTNWFLSSHFSGLEILDNGVIYMPALRELGMDNRSWGVNAGKPSNPPFEVTGGKAQLLARPLRVTLAIPCDHGLSRGVMLSSDGQGAGQSGGEMSIGGSSPDQELLDPDLERRSFLDFGSLYDLWERKGSYPLPESAGGTAATDEVLRTDATMLRSHLKRHLFERGRLRRSGVLIIGGHLTNAFQPGDAVKKLHAVGASKTDLPVNAVIWGVRLLSQQGDPPANQTELLFQ